MIKKRDENMNNKRNIIVMFLFVMLSFAIISEVSAVSDAEANGTGLDLPIQSVDMTNHDIAGESNNRFMQNHDNDYMDDLKSHNEQNSFNNSPQLGDKDIENKNFYEHENGMFKPDDNGTLDFNRSMGMFKPDDNGTLDFNKSMDMFKPMGDKPLNDSSVNLRNNNGTAVPNGEAVKNVAPDLKDGKNMTGPKPMDNVSKQTGFNKTPVMAKNIENNKKAPTDKKPKAKAAKNTKSKTVKKVKSVKKTKNSKVKSVKKVNNSKSKAIEKSKMLNKKSTKERAKL